MIFASNTGTIIARRCKYVGRQTNKIHKAKVNTKGMKPKIFLIGLVILLFVFRLIYGLCSDFWFDDQLQIYLIGLKSFTTNTWPYFGPDVVYTNTQIPGALQGLLVSSAFYILPIPEAPCILLNVLCFISLFSFSLYISKRIAGLSFWLILAWIMMLTWPMDFGTKVVNPSYVLIFSVPFFIALFELLPIYKTSLLPRTLAYFVLGVTPGLIMQLHLSYFLLLPLIGLVAFFELKTNRTWRNKLAYVGSFLGGFLVGILTLIPTYVFIADWKSTSSNIVFNLENFKNIFTVLVRYLFFASFEVSYMLGGSTPQRLEVIQSGLWAAPFSLYLLLFGFLLIGAFIFVFFKKEKTEEWQKIKYLNLFVYVVTFVSFFFSIKGPSPHTFYIVFPLVVFYSFYCHEWLILQYRHWKNLMILALVSCFFFYTSLGLYNYKNKSLYKNRETVQRAINEKNYKLLGQRRADQWGYGY